MQRHAITSNKMQSHSIAKTAIPSYIPKWKDPGYRSLPMFMDFPPNFSLKTRKLLREGLENRNNGFRPLRGNRFGGYPDIIIVTCGSCSACAKLSGHG